MITLSLIHPTQAAPIQRWTFEREAVVRVGRSKDNDVVVHGSLVSRHHLELWNRQTHWEIVNFGTNGTFVNGQPVRQMPVCDGMTIRLGATGPKLQLQLSSDSASPTVPPSRSNIAPS
ncbi:FHA domain-containing protein [Geitlerinema sp. CS-897]|nr:FHA domain-containing protein [Geitlerinema sp. CS-897]